ncbi:hypothetical protein [Hoeflea sp.]|uniref:hypothetical protein n=1 Tax=Hoeflea sp. TaxID=1940281 RepID=UPI003B52BBB7
MTSFSTRRREELLADFEQDEAIEQAGLEDSHADDDLETGLDEGISGELEDLFSFDDDDAPSGSEDTNSAGDLELDMEQVLAEAVIDPASTSQSAASNRSSDDLEQALAGAVAPSAMRGASTVAANRDEMAEAFRDLVSDQDDEAPVVAAPGEVEADARGEAPAVDDDWFSGASGGSADTGRREVPDDEGFFFDSDLIAEPDEPLETLSGYRCS